MKINQILGIIRLEKIKEISINFSVKIKNLRANKEEIRVIKINLKRKHLEIEILKKIRRS